MSDRSQSPSGPMWFVWSATILLAVFGGAAIVQGPTKPEDAKGPLVPASPPEESRSRSDEYDPLLLVREYFRFTEPAPPPPKPVIDLRIRGRFDPGGGFHLRAESPAAPDDRTPLNLPSHAPFQVEAMIAFVPDPVDSKFAYEFDATVQAIQWAFQARGMILHSSALPWKRGADGKPEGDLHRRAPGVLLFRRIRKEQLRDEKRSEQPEETGLYRRILCAVFLVGENPISGPHKLALRRALDAVDELRHAVTATRPWFWPLPSPHDFRPGAADALPVVGPYYSGSAAILKNSLRVWGRDQSLRGAAEPRFRVISGSATAVNPNNMFYDPSCTFQATVIPTDLVINAVLDYMARGPGRRILPTLSPTDDTQDPRSQEQAEWRLAVARLGPIANLRESNTGFGSAVGSQRGQHTGSGAERPVEMIDLPFPTSISQLKVDLDKMAPATPAGVPTLPPAFEAPRLPVKDDFQVDGVPLQDRDSSVALAAQSLREILETIDREGVRVVGITATDDRDVVFLNRLLKKYCPAVRVFATGSSTVMTQPAESYHMRGLVLGSTYPLYPANQSWVDTWLRLRLPFPSQSAQGVYNAVLAQFGEFGQLLEYRPPSFDASARPASRPPIWISVVGQNGDLIPVRIYRDYDDTVPPPRRLKLGEAVPDRYLFDPTPDRPAAWQPIQPFDAAPEPSVGEGPAATTLSVQPSRAFLLLLFAMAALATGIAVAVWRSWRIWYLHDPTNEPGAAPEQIARLVLWAAGWLGLMAVVPVLGAWHFDRHPPWLWATGAVLWVLLMAAIVLAGLVWRRLVGGPRGVVARVRLVIVSGAWLLAAYIAIHWVLADWDQDQQFLWLVRASDLSSGLSPVLPTVLLAAALATLAVFRLRQAAAVRFQAISCPVPGGKAYPWAEVVAQDRRVKRLFGAAVPGPASAWVESCRARINRTMSPAGSPHSWLTRAWIRIRLWAWWSSRRWVWTRVALRRWQTYVVLLPVVGFASWFCIFLHSTPEPHAWEVVIRCAAWLAVTLIAVMLVRFLVLWAATKNLLDRIGDLPMAVAFENLPDRASRLFAGYLFSIRPDRFDHVVRQQLAVFGPAHCSACDLNAIARDILDGLVATWQRRSVNEAFGRSAPPAGAADQPEGAAGSAVAAPPRGGPPTPDPREVFVALLFVRYVSQFIVALRSLALSLTVSAPLLLLAAASYPFQPERPLLYALMALLAAVVAGILYVLYDLNRNELVSRITKTTPNRFTPDRGFLASVAQYVLPVVGVAIAYMVGAFRVVAEPLLNALR